jgi:hypothetical protein
MSDETGLWFIYFEFAMAFVVARDETATLNVGKF